MIGYEPVIWKNLIDRNVEQRLEGKWGRGLTKDKWRKEWDRPDGMFDWNWRRAIAIYRSTSKCKQEGPDGMDTIVHNDQTEQRMFDKPNLCQQCRKTPVLL